MRLVIGFVLLVMGATIVGLPHGTAAAQTCATINLSARTVNTTFVVGRKYARTCPGGGPCTDWVATNETGWCYKQTGTTTNATNPGSADCLGKWLVVTLGSGNDTFAPVPTNTTVTCDPFTQLRPFNDPALGSPKLQVYGGPGSDLIYGGPWQDLLVSNTFIPPLFGGAGDTPADGVFDSLCGMGGPDSLLGDNDDSAGALECLVGGNGTGDTCTGAYVTATPYFDYGHSPSCETATGTTSTRPAACTLALVTACTAAEAPSVW